MSKPLSAGDRLHYPYYDTPIEQYLHVKNDEMHNSGVNFEENLLKKIRERTDKTKPFKILDIGAGSGVQWLNFLQKHDLTHGVDVEIHVTTLLRKEFHSRYYDGDLKQFAKPTSVEGILSRYPHNSFDLIVSNMGMHEMENQGIRHALVLLKQDGELHALGALPETLPRQGVKPYEVIRNQKSTKDKRIKSITLRKK